MIIKVDGRPCKSFQLLNCIDTNQNGFCWNDPSLHDCDEIIIGKGEKTYMITEIRKGEVSITHYPNNIYSLSYTYNTEVKSKDLIVLSDIHNGCGK